MKQLWKYTAVKWSESLSSTLDSLRPRGQYSPWNFPGPNTGVDNLSLLWGTFPTHGLSPGLPHSRWILYQLSHMGSPFRHNEEFLPPCLYVLLLPNLTVWFKKSSLSIFYFVGDQGHKHKHVNSRDIILYSKDICYIGPLQKVCML